MYCPECGGMIPCYTSGCSRSLTTPLVRPQSRMVTIANELMAAWQRAPDQRLGQFLLNLAGTADIWHIEDEAWLAALREFRWSGEFT